MWSRRVKTPHSVTVQSVVPNVPTTFSFRLNSPDAATGVCQSVWLFVWSGLQLVARPPAVPTDSACAAAGVDTLATAASPRAARLARCPILRLACPEITMGNLTELGKGRPRGHGMTSVSAEL